MTKTTFRGVVPHGVVLWFAQNSLPLWWQRQPFGALSMENSRCDLLKIHYLCGDKDNTYNWKSRRRKVVICSKFITFVVTKTTYHQLRHTVGKLWFAQNSLPLWWQRQPHLLAHLLAHVVICSKFITFVVTKTTNTVCSISGAVLWFAQNSLPLWWQRQLSFDTPVTAECCDLLKIHYLCGDKDNNRAFWDLKVIVVICSKFITFVVTKTTLIWYLADNQRNIECIRNKKRCCLKRRTHG